MNNLLSYCGLVDARVNPSDKDLPVCVLSFQHVYDEKVEDSDFPHFGWGKSENTFF